MTPDVGPERVRAWIDDDLVESVDRMPDETAEFNYVVEMSNILVHVLRREPGDRCSSDSGSSTTRGSGPASGNWTRPTGTTRSSPR